MMEGTKNAQQQVGATEADSSFKSFACQDAGASCNWSTTGRTEDEILDNVRNHAQAHHPEMKFTDQLKEKVRSLIRPVTGKAA